MPWVWVTGERSSLLAALTRDQHFPHGPHRVDREFLDSRLVGNDLWTVWETRVNGIDGGRQIRLDQVEFNDDSQRWGHRSVAEGQGRFMPLTCPVAFFDLAPAAPHGEAAAWRAAVRTQAIVIAMNAPRIDQTELGSSTTPRVIPGPHSIDRHQLSIAI